MTYQLFIDNQRIQDNLISLSKEETHYVLHVIRLKIGDHLLIVDQDGRKFDCEATTLKRKEVVLTIRQQLSIWNESVLDLRLVQAISRNPKMELIIQRCTELGIREFYPVVTSRSFRPGNRQISDKWQKRWEIIAMEAARQCKRNVVPRIHEILSLQELLPTLENPFIGLFCREDVTATDSPPFDGTQRPDFPVYILIGPEGGFSSHEAEKVLTSGFSSINLGPRILRMETAAIAATSIVQYCWGDLSPNISQTL